MIDDDDQSGITVPKRRWARLMLLGLALLVAVAAGLIAFLLTQGEFTYVDESVNIQLIPPSTS